MDCVHHYVHENTTIGLRKLDTWISRKNSYRINHQPFTLSPLKWKICIDFENKKNEREFAPISVSYIDKACTLPSPSDSDCDINQNDNDTQQEADKQDEMNENNEMDEGDEE